MKGRPLLHRELFLNVANGGLLFVALRLTLVRWVEGATAFHLLPTPWLSAGWSQALFSFVVLDLMRYWLHFAHHRVPFLWSFHRVHHSAEFIDSTSGLRMHAMDFVQLSALPILLFGVVLDTTAWAPWVVPSVLVIGALMDAFEHANIAMDMTKPWNKAWNLVFNNPHFHSWHHTIDGHVLDGNYGNSLTIWDRLFGTDVSRQRPPGLYGLAPWKQLQTSIIGWQLLRRVHPDLPYADRPELFDAVSSDPSWNGR